MDLFAGCGGPDIRQGDLEEKEETVVNPEMGKPGRKWTQPEKWQLGIGLLGLLLAIIATVGQFVR
ncbi:hypothetical protein ACGFRG_07955 [Streptomyces sp. NPDC048696]|uniref:hypothetical protein n=1 Tax=Streptomyces sp. NPDC048696 TaxID=3365585 RepID=UPI00371FF165